MRRHACRRIRVPLQDIDWSAGTLKVTRPRGAFTLPLLPAVANVLARHLCEGRPPNTPTLHMFVRSKMPFGPLSASSASLQRRKRLLTYFPFRRTWDAPGP
jgi:hypothetical protein